MTFEELRKKYGLTDQTTAGTEGKASGTGESFNDLRKRYGFSDEKETSPAAPQQGTNLAFEALRRKYGMQQLQQDRQNSAKEKVDSYQTDIIDFSKKVGTAWEGMDYYNYQDTIRDYTGQRDQLLQRTDELIGYLNENADLYEKESLDGMLEWLEGNKSYLQNVGNGLDQQKGFYDSFISEKDYTLYDTYKDTSAEDLRAKAKTEQDWETRDWMEKRAAALEYKAPRALDVIDRELKTVKEQLKQQEEKDLKALEEWSLWFSTDGASSPSAKAPANGGVSEETQALQKRLAALETERQAAVSQERAASAPKLPDTVAEIDAELEQIREEINIALAEDLEKQRNYGSYIPLAASKKREDLEAKQTQLMQKRAAILAEDLLENKYAYVMKAPDFEKNSQYAGMKNILADSDYGYINGDKRAEGLYDYTLNNSRQQLLGMDRTWVTRMRENEKKIYNYLYNTAGRSKANEFLSELEPVLLKRQREDEERFARWDAQEDPWGTSIATVLSAPLKPLAFVGQTIDGLDGTIDPNAAYNRNLYTSKAIREEVPKNWGPVGSFAYQTGMSMADFLTTTAVAGGNPTIAMTIMGSGAAADTTLEALDRGLGSGQAYTLGVVAGIAEALTERFSLDALLDKTALTKSALGYWLKNVLAEGSEEVSSSLINNFADLMISKDKSQWVESVQAYRDKGYNDSEAFWKAMGDQAASLGLDFLGGAASGGTIALPGVALKGAGLVSNTQNQGTTPAVQQPVEPGAVQTPAGVTNAPQVAMQNPVAAEQNPVIPEQNPTVAEQTAVKTEQQPQTPSQSGETSTVINNREAMQRKLQAAEEAYKTGVISMKELQKVRREAKALDITNTIPETDRVDIDRARAAYEAGEIDEETYYQIEDAYREQQEQLGTAPAVDEQIQYTENENQELSFAQQQRLAESQKEGANYESEEFEPTLIGNGGLVGGFIRKSVPDGGSQRAAGAGTRGEAGQLSGSAAEQTATANPGRAAIQRRNLAQNLRLDKVSSEELVPGRGTVGKKNTILPAENWDTQMQEVAQRVKQETGKEVVYVLGGIEVKTKHGTKTVNGVYDGNQIIIRADHMRLSIDQIADHETYHALIDANGGRYRMITKLREYILERYDADSFNRIMDKYIAGLTGIVDVTENMSQEAWEDALLRVMEEIFADAYAGINAFGAHAEQLQEIVRPWVQENMLPQARQQSNGTRQTNGPNDTVRYSSDEGNNYEGRSLIDDPEIYSYDFLTSQKPMKTVKLPTVASVRDNEGRIDPGKIAEDGIENALSVGTERDGKVYVKNRYTARELWVTAAAIRHGLNGTANRMLTNARLGSVIGEIVENAIPINALHNTAKGVKGTYAMAGYAFDQQGREFVAIVTVEQRTETIADIAVYDMTHAISGRQKRGSQEGVTPAVIASNEGNQADTKSQGSNPIKVSSEISIADLLESVKEVYQSILSEDVLENLGETRNPKGHYANRVRYSYDGEIDEEIAERQVQGTDKIAPTQQELERERQAWLQKEYNDKQKKPENKPVIAKQRLVKGLFDTFSIPTESRDEIKTVIENFADRMQRKGGVQQEDLRDLFDRLYSSGVMTVEADEYNSYARSMVAKGRIYVGDSVKADFGDDWAGIRKRAFAAGVYLVNDRSASGIDQWNRTLASDDMLPGLFDPEETDMRAVLERIISVAEAGKDEQMSLPEYTALLAQQEYVSENEILENMERQLETALRIFGENASLEVQLRDRADRRVEREHQKGNERLYKKAYAEEQRRAREKDRRRQMSQQQRERKELSELQQKTLKALQWLHKNQRRAPEELRETWNEVLSDIDILAVGAANAMNWSDKYDASWADLADMYDKAKETDPNFMPSDELEKIVTRIRGRKLGDMDIEALQELYRAAVALRTEFYNRNNVINDEEHRLFSEVYADSKAELREAPKTAKRGKVKGSADKLFNLQQLTPMNVIQRLVGWNPNSQFFSLIAKQLEEGERGVRAHTVKANRLLEEFLKENEAWVKKADGQGKKGIWYSLEVPELLELHMGDKPIFGETVTVYFTPLQKVHMYLESKNHENMRHMTGGRTFVDKELYSKGERRQAFANGRTVRLAPETVKKMVADLTAEEKALADLLDSYYNGMAHDEINRTSNVLYGYDKAIGKNYAPICTNEFYTKKELGKLDRTAEGAGHLKERVVSKNPSLMISCLDAFERNVEQTARFVGMAIPARNAKTLMNWRDANTSMTQEISNNGGVQTVDYIQNLITELESGGSFEERDAVSEFGDKLQSQYISSVFGANWGIVVKQLGSIPMAAPYLGFKNLPKLQKVNTELIAKYTQELAWRGMGYATPETKVLKENPSKLRTNKTVQFLFGGGAITWMDSQAAKVLWPWAEKKVAKEFPDLLVGDQEMIDAGQSPFYKKVAEEFNNALSRSQSVSDAMHQSTLRKSKNLFTKAFTMFRSDSAQTYNVIRQMLGEASYYKRIGDKKLVGATQRKLGWAILAMILNAFCSGTVDFFKNLLEKKAANYRNEEDELTAGSIAAEMVWDMFSSIAGTFVYGDTIADVVGSVAFDRYSYDTESLAFELYNKVTKLPDEIKGKVDSGEWLGAVKLVVDNAATLFGIPLANVEKTVIGALNWFFPEVGVAWEDLWENPDKASLKGLTGEALQVRIGNILDDRTVECTDGTIETLAALYEAGFTDAVPTAIPDSVKIGDENHKLSKADSKHYEAVWNSVVADNVDALVSCDAFIGADQKLQSKMLNRLYEYASAKSKEQLFGDYQLEDSKKKIDELLAAGLTVADSISWAAVSADLKRKEQYTELKTWELTEDQKKAAIGYVLGTELETEKGGQTEYAKMLEATSLGLKVDQYLELRLQDISTDKFLENVKASKNADDAFELTIDTSKLEPMKGYKKVSEIQEWLVIAERPLPESYKIIQLEGKMDEAEQEELRAVTDAGIRTYIYVTFLYDIRGWGSDRDANGREIKKLSEKIDEYINGLDLTEHQKDVLFLTQYPKADLSKTSWHN